MKQDATATKQNSTKSYTWLIYLVAWLVIMLIQSILVGQSSTMAESLFQAPSHYPVSYTHLTLPTKRIV